MVIGASAPCNKSNRRRPIAGVPDTTRPAGTVVGQGGLTMKIPQSGDEDKGRERGRHLETVDYSSR